MGAPRKDRLNWIHTQVHEGKRSLLLLVNHSHTTELCFYWHKRNSSLSHRLHNLVSRAPQILEKHWKSLEIFVIFLYLKRPTYYYYLHCTISEWFWAFYDFNCIIWIQLHLFTVFWFIKIYCTISWKKLQLTVVCKYCGTIFSLLCPSVLTLT